MTEIMSRETQTEVEGPAQHFTGRVAIRGQFAREEPSRVTGAIVTFEAGARTAWHSHPLGQTLVVIDGVGWTQVENDPIQEFAAGDILLCPRNRRHWHGATPESSMPRRHSGGARRQERDVDGEGDRRRVLGWPGSMKWSQRAATTSVRREWSSEGRGISCTGTDPSSASPSPPTHSGSGPSSGRPVKNLAAMQPPWQAS